MKIFVVAEREQPVVELCAGARQFADEVDLIALPTTSVAPGVADTVYRLEVPEGRMMEDSYLALVDLIEKEKPSAVMTRPRSILCAPQRFLMLSQAVRTRRQSFPSSSLLMK